MRPKETATINDAIKVLTRQQRKSRRLREREALFLDVARRLFLEHGYHGFTMEQIAGATEYSKGTLYQQRAFGFRGRPRERMVAVGEAAGLFAHLYRDSMRLLHIIEAETIIVKASEGVLSAMKTYASRTTRVTMDIIHDAIRQGDLVLGPGNAAEDLAFSFWVLTDGGFSAAASWLPLYDLGIRNPSATVLKSCHILGDGHGWRPLSTEWDYEATRRRIRTELFPEESRKAYGTSVAL